MDNVVETPLTGTGYDPANPTPFQQFLIRWKLGTMQPDGLVELGTIPSLAFGALAGIALVLCMVGAMALGQWLGERAAELAGRGWKRFAAWRAEGKPLEGETVPA